MDIAKVKMDNLEISLKSLDGFDFAKGDSQVSKAPDSK